MQENMQLLAEVQADGFTTRIIRCGCLYHWVKEFSPEEIHTMTMSARAILRDMTESMLVDEAEYTCLRIAALKDPELLPALIAAETEGQGWSSN